ncbi:MAG: hypothetical protein ILO68_05035, partial [Clostridia bacterium]|nr:hypothetical protein [Clostridia bacterium]
MVRTDSIKKRIFALICAICMLVAGYGDLFRYTLLADTRTFTVSASDGNTYRITVNFDAASGIPEDAVLSVREIQKDEGGYTEASGESGPLYDRYVGRSAEILGKESNSFDVARVFDISLISPSDGTEYQPKKDVAVNIELLDNDLSCHTGVSVVHFSGVPEEDAEVMETEMQGDTVTFSSDGFSVYVVTTETVLCTYYFFSYNNFGEYQSYVFYDDQGNQVSSQTIKNGEKLVAPFDPPADPTAPNKEFKGWFEGDDPDNLSSEPFDFNQPQNLAPGSNTEVYLYAVFTEYAYVHFHGQYDTETHTYPLVETARVELTGDPDADKIDLTEYSAPHYDAGGNSAYPEFTFY